MLKLMKRVSGNWKMFILCLCRTLICRFRCVMKKKLIYFFPLPSISVLNIFFLDILVFVCGFVVSSGCKFQWPEIVCKSDFVITSFVQVCLSPQRMWRKMDNMWIDYVRASKQTNKRTIWKAFAGWKTDSIVHRFQFPFHCWSHTQHPLNHAKNNLIHFKWHEISWWLRFWYIQHPHTRSKPRRSARDKRWIDIIVSATTTKC